MATYGSARNDTPSSARSAASSIGGKGGTSGSSSTGGARSGAGGAGGVRGSSKSESAGSKATSAAAGAASSVGSKSAASSGPGGAGGVRNTSTGTRASQTSSNAADRAAAASRGLLGSDRGGSILSNPSVVSRSVGGLLNGAAKMNAQYGEGTYNAPFGSNFRGPLGPLGELRTGITPQTRAYQAAEIARAAYPASFGRFTQPQVSDYMGALARVTPFEADVKRFGTPAMNPIARTAINQVIAGQQWNDKMLADRVPAGLAGTALGASLAGLDTQQARKGTLGLDVSPSEPGTPMNTLASMSINDALMQRGVPAGLMNANNFVAKGTPNVPGTTPIGSYRGTAYASDPTNGISDRVAAANQRAAGILADGSPAPSLADAVTSAPTLGRAEKIASLVAAAPKMQDRIAAEPNLNGLGFQQAAYNDRGVPSPMAGQGILGPSGLANMADLGMRQAISPSYTGAAMAQHQLAPPQRNAIMEDDMDMPAAIAQGMPVPSYDRRRNNFYTGMGAELANVAPGLMSAIRATPPSTNVETYTGYNRSRSPFVAGESMTASAPRSMGPDMARTDTPTSAWNGDVLGPINPQPLSAGMSFTPGMPRNPIGGMAFNPSMPRNPIGGMSFNPGMPGQMPSDPRSRSPFVSGPPQIASQQPNPFAGLENAFPKTEKRITAADIPAIASPDQRTRVIGNWPSFGPMGIPDQPGLQGPVNVADLPEPAPMVSPPATIQDTPSPLDKVQPKDVEKVINKLTDAFRYLGTSPEKRLADARHFDTRENYSDRGGNLPTQWTGRESESQVAAMAKNVEEVLRGYFVQIPGQQYPQYTTGPA